MEPVRFEENMREQLEKREIQPSAGSWEKLQGRLEQEKSKSGPKFWWIGAAAAIAAVFFVLGTFFSNPVMQNNPAVVENPSEEVVPQKIIQQPQEAVVLTTQKGENQEEFQEEKLPEETRVAQVAVAASAEEKIQEKAPSEEEKSQVFETVAPSEAALAEISQPTSVEVQDSEIDALLERATAEINANPTAYDVLTVDANQLLDEVEYELDQSFRQKVFETIKEGIFKAKTAVVSRNF